MKSLNEIKNCERCDLCKTRYNVVLGRGNISLNTCILIIGEAPGATEDLIGEAFVGLSGKLLDTMLKEVGFDLNECYFLNTILCRPTDKKSGKNRIPNVNEILACRYNIEMIMSKIPFQFVILIGEIAKKYFIKTFPIATCIQLPAYLLRTGGVKSPHYQKNINRLQELGGKYYD